MLYGPSALGAMGNLTVTVGFIGGLSVPFNLWGFNSTWEAISVR